MQPLSQERSEILEAVAAHLPDSLQDYLWDSLKLLAHSAASKPNPTAVRVVGKSYTDAERLENGLRLR